MAPAPDEHVMGMFHNILPPHVVDEIRKQRDLKTLQPQIDWVTGAGQIQRRTAVKMEHVQVGPAVEDRHK